MSRDMIHAIEGKCRNGILDYKDVPINVLKKWNRYNFDIGFYKYKKRKLLEKTLDVIDEL